MQEDYVEPIEFDRKLTSSPSMYVRIKSWLLLGKEEDPPELLRGALINLKVGLYVVRRSRGSFMWYLYCCMCFDPYPFDIDLFLAGNR